MNDNDKKPSSEAQKAIIPLGEYVLRVVLVLLTIGFFGFMTFLWYYYSNTTRESDYCRKDDLKKELKTKISNGADLKVVEYVFSKRNMKSQNIRIWNFNIEKDYYDNNTKLLQVLKDLQSDYFDAIPYTIPQASRDTAYYSRLSMMIDEYMRKTPFDGLEEGQMALFINLQKVLGDDYESVEENIIRIANELESKNALVDKYLNNSNDSYRLSRIALIATIVFGVLSFIIGVIGLMMSKRARRESI